MNVLYVHMTFFILGPPEPPSNPPEIMDVTKSSVSLSWARPRDDGGSRITGYYVERREVSTEKWVRHNKTHITTTMYNITGLIPDAEYIFRVVAQNDVGQSEPGPASDSVVCKDPFGELTQYCLIFYCTVLSFVLYCEYYYHVSYVSPYRQTQSARRD